MELVQGTDFLGYVHKTRKADIERENENTEVITARPGQ